MTRNKQHCTDGLSTWHEGSHVVSLNVSCRGCTLFCQDVTHVWCAYSLHLNAICYFILYHSWYLNHCIIKITYSLLFIIHGILMNHDLLYQLKSAHDSPLESTTKQSEVTAHHGATMGSGRLSRRWRPACYQVSLHFLSFLSWISDIQ